MCTLEVSSLKSLPFLTTLPPHWKWKLDQKKQNGGFLRSSWVASIQVQPSWLWLLWDCLHTWASFSESHTLQGVTGGEHLRVPSSTMTCYQYSLSAALLSNETTWKTFQRGQVKASCHSEQFTLWLSWCPALHMHYSGWKSSFRGRNRQKQHVYEWRRTKSHLLTSRLLRQCSPTELLITHSANNRLEQNTPTRRSVLGNKEDPILYPHSSIPQKNEGGIIPGQIWDVCGCPQCAAGVFRTAKMGIYGWTR